MSNARLLTREMLDRLSKHWRRLGAPIAESLRPGLSDTQIDAMVAPLGLRLPSEARMWWGWHDGTESTRLSHALGNGIVALPLEQGSLDTVRTGGSLRNSFAID